MSGSITPAFALLAVVGMVFIYAMARLEKANVWAARLAALSVLGLAGYTQALPMIVGGIASQERALSTVTGNDGGAVEIAALQAERAYIVAWHKDLGLEVGPGDDPCHSMLQDLDERLAALGAM